MAAELVAQRREKPSRKRIVLTRAVPGKQRRGNRGQGNASIDRLLHRPAAFARVVDIRLELREIAILRERPGGKVEKPGSHHAAVPPQLRDGGEVDRV